MSRFSAISAVLPVRWGAVLAAGVLLSGCVVTPVEGEYRHGHYDRNETVIYHRYGHPPPPRAERRPSMPGPGYAWEQGEWVWNAGRYHWRPGRWQYVRPVPPPHSHVRPGPPPYVRPGPPPPVRPPAWHPNRPPPPPHIGPHTPPERPHVRPPRGDRPAHERPPHGDGPPRREHRFPYGERER